MMTKEFPPVFLFTSENDGNNWHVTLRATGQHIGYVYRQPDGMYHTIRSSGSFKRPEVAALTLINRDTIQKDY
jgi:hypothetical protein